MARNLMSDEEWVFFEHFILAAGALNGRRPVDHRVDLDSTFWISRTGAPWRDVQERFGKWAGAHQKFRR